MQCNDITRPQNMSVRLLTMLTDAAARGELTKRGDDAQFQGSFREVVRGMNQTVENILRPVNEVVACLGEMAKGDLAVTVSGDYQGDHAAMKDALNSALHSLNEILAQVAQSSNQISIGASQVSDSSSSLSDGATRQGQRAAGNHGFDG